MVNKQTIRFFLISIGLLAIGTLIPANNHSAMLENPLTTLDNIHKTLISFEKELKQTKPEEISRLIEHYEKSSPIFLLSECNASGCLLSRKNTPKYRAEYETEVANKLLAKLDQNNNAAIFASFGSGKLFADLLILHKVLKQRPNATISMHFIDIAYKPLFTKKCEMPQELTAFINYTLFAHMKKQFLHFLQKTFPLATLNLQLYKDKDEYLWDCASEPRRYPDLIHAEDIYDAWSAANNGLPHYLDLLYHIAKNKPLAEGLSLADEHGTIYRGAKILTFSRCAEPNSQFPFLEKRLWHYTSQMPNTEQAFIALLFIYMTIQFFR